MANVKKVSYFKMMVPNRPGQGARALGELQKAGINLTAFSGFPHRGGAQMDFIPAKPSAFRKVARKNKWKIAAPKRAVLVRDLTDSQYNPRCWPYVDHFRGTQIFIEHVEQTPRGLCRSSRLHSWRRNGASSR